MDDNDTVKFRTPKKHKNNTFESLDLATYPDELKTPLKRTIKTAQKIVDLYNQKRDSIDSTPEETENEQPITDISSKIVEEQKEFLNLIENSILKMEEERSKYKEQRDALEAKFKDLEMMEQKTSKELQIIRQQIKRVDVVTEALETSEIDTQSLKQRRTSAIQEISNIENEFLTTRRKSILHENIKIVDIQQKSDTAQDLQRQLEEKEAELAALRSQLDERNREILILHEDFKRKEMEFDLAKIEIEQNIRSELEGKIDVLTAKYQQEHNLRRDYYNQLQELKGNIRVFCRVRPLSEEEGAMSELANCSAFMAVDFPTENTLSVNKKRFEFDRVFEPEVDQLSVFNEVKPLITSVLDGYNCCIFAYGQTGSGKTFTMEGTDGNRGVNYRAIDDLFKEIRDRSSSNKFTLSVSMLEIYNEQLRDLLCTQDNVKLEIKQSHNGSTYVSNLSSFPITSIDEAWEYLSVGKTNRAVGSTDCNEHSSRSHSLLMINVVGENLLTRSRVHSKLTLIDLAGSERVAKSNATGERLKEATHINKSLSALGNVVSSLLAKAPHVPYRDSKLTYLLKDSLGGDSKTLMFVQVSPAQQSVAETVCSLQFAMRVRNVELGPAKQNIEDPGVMKYKDQARKAIEAFKAKNNELEEVQQKLRQSEDRYMRLESMYSQALRVRGDSNSTVATLTNVVSQLTTTTPKVESFALSTTKRSVKGKARTPKVRSATTEPKEATSAFQFQSPTTKATLRASVSTPTADIKFNGHTSPIPDAKSAASSNPIVNSIYSSWKEHVKERIESSFLNTTKENLDNSIVGPTHASLITPMERKSKAVRFADSPQNKPSLKRKPDEKPIIPVAVPSVSSSPFTSRPQKRMMTTRSAARNLAVAIASASSTPKIQTSVSPFADKSTSWTKTLRSSTTSSKQARRIQIVNSKS